MADPHEGDAHEQRDFIRGLGEGLLALSSDERAYAELADALARQDEAAFRSALTRIPIPDSPAAGRFICRTIGYKPQPGTWTWVCRWTKSGEVFGSEPKRLNPSQKTELQAAAKAETPQQILDRLIRMGLVSCDWEYQHGELVPVQWCDVVFAPERPPLPGPSPDPPART